MLRIAMPVGKDFEDSEFSKPYERLRAAGHEVVVIGTRATPAGEELEGKQGLASARIDAHADALRADAFDALVIPGGYGPDHLRLDASVVELVRRIVESGKLVAAVCHGPQLLIEADMVNGRTLTSWPSVRKDLENAGATWVDRELVEDGNLITSRKPDDLDAFCDALVERLRTVGSRH